MNTKILTKHLIKQHIIQTHQNSSQTVKRYVNTTVGEDNYCAVIEVDKHEWISSDKYRWQSGGCTLQMAEWRVHITDGVISHFLHESSSCGKIWW